MVNLSATEDEWQTDDETGYENPYDYDPHAIDENDPTVEGDDPNAFDEDETDLEDDDPSLNPDESDEDEPDSDNAEHDEIEPMYPNYEAWVEGWFTQVIRRKMGPGGGESGLAWDARWWLYPEVAGRLKALWYAWEEARASDKASAVSNWWIHHLEPHMRVIFDSDSGPMSHAKADGSFSGWPALPYEPMPPSLRDEYTAAY
ncbi:DUF4913 domain-containing protein [Rhodococcus opacus]|uniref:DUF4913 domain-containing protein n=1 Tax=Rhodococcus opacus TaxID=37919 RepID=UPI001F560C48|nr:DUF4913 domain-containing protein [Rhodococcus opacus]UNN05231.1 DUF4913 domain-containing protein [Rhodococcus opacus]